MAFEFNRRPDEWQASHHINVTPFIDVMLVLLVIFMVTAPLTAVHIPVQLPASSSEPQPAAENPVVLTVQQDLGLALGNTSITRAELASALQRLTRGDRTTRIYVRADQNIRYGQLMAVMDLLRAAGYQRVALVSREAGSPASTAPSPPAAPTPPGAR